MPDPEPTTGTPSKEVTTDEGSVRDAFGDGLSDQPEVGVQPTPEQLGEEFKPYSQFPWDKLPPEAREEFLAGVKKFHGDMTKGHEDLRRQRDETSQKAKWFDELTGQDWFMKAYMGQKNGGVAQEPERPKIEKLTEFGIERPAVDQLQAVIRDEMQNALKPYQQHLQSLQQVILDRQAADELSEIRTFATEKKLPSPDDIVPRMSELLRSGEARSLKAAYRIAVFDDALGLAEQRGRKTLEEELQRKAGATFPPTRGPSQAPGEEQFVGRDGVMEAFRAAQAERLRNK